MPLEDGKKLVVGSHEATVVRFLLQGGFSHIYHVDILPPENGSTDACLKQVIVPDKPGLNALRNEVEVMKKLRDARSIVRYYDSHAERLENGTYQVLVLMELCPNKSLLDFMNMHIRDKLSEKTILGIMRDIGIGVYEMHRLHLVHRDIKIENVLIDAHHHFKLGDFGLVQPPVPPPHDQAQFQALAHDILYHTTPQYRSPEMIDLYRGFPIDERADMWALGCFLYKLCYYTTPFEASGDIAILHASFQFPPGPVYLGDLKNLIIIMLQESPLYRPNIVQLLMLLSRMMGEDIEQWGIEDFYRAGEYNFHALHEMQRQKQLELLKQQQYYYEQRERERESQMGTPRARLREGRTEGDQGEDEKRREEGKRSQSQEQIQGKVQGQTQNHGQIQNQSQNVGQVAQIPVPAGQVSAPPGQVSVPAGQVSVPAVSVSAPAVPVSAPSEAQPQALPENSPVLMKSNSSLRSVRSEKSYHTTLSPEIVSTQSASAGSDSGSEVDIDALALEDAENRYPSLDALDGPTPQISVLRTLSGKTGQNIEKPKAAKRKSQYESIDAWQRLSASLNKDAEKLAGEIFVSRTTTNSGDDEQRQRTGGSTKTEKKREMLGERERPYEKPYQNVEDSYLKVEKPYTKVDKPYEQAEKFDPSTFEATAFADAEKLFRTSSYDGKEKTLEEPLQFDGAIPSEPKEPKIDGKSDYEKVDASLLDGFPQAVPVLRYDQPQPGFLFGEFQKASPPEAYAPESANPWGSLLRKEQPQSDMSFQADLAQLKLNVEERKEPKMPENLIDLDQGVLADVPYSKRYEEVSLLDIDQREARPMYKKKISEMQSQGAVQEEVIDFASDDENYNSEMSRVAIRNSLKKPKSRKLSEHHKRGDSHDHRKRLSFFGD